MSKDNLLLQLVNYRSNKHFAFQTVKRLQAIIYIYIYIYIYKHMATYLLGMII
jgi:hypothetical protein